MAASKLSGQNMFLHLNKSNYTTLTPPQPISSKKSMKTVEH